MERAANSNNMDNIEIILNVHIVTDKFSTSNGLLTSTQKNKREAIQKMYQAELLDMYYTCYKEI